MKAAGLTERIAIAVIGMPRSGTTIVCSFLNSLDRSSVWGEAHRVTWMQLPRIMPTRYGNGILYPYTEVLGQMKDFAVYHDLLIYGSKDVPDLYIDPIEIVEGYGDRLDKVFVVFRNPRKVWKSMCSLGHTSGLGIKEADFIAMYNEYMKYCLQTDNAISVVLERFRNSPKGYMSAKLGYPIVGNSTLLRYTGTGSPHTTRDGTTIHKNNEREEDDSPSLNTATRLYSEILKVD